MRTVDLLGLALSALRRRKLRTLLTTLGVTFGTFVLVASLSLRDGVRETIRRQYGRYGELRRIDVYGGGPAPAAPAGSRRAAPEEVEVAGRVGEERRRRLREEIARRRDIERPPAPGSFLTPRRLAALRELPHVAAVTLDMNLGARVFLNGRGEHTTTMAARPDDDKLARRLIAGGPLPAPDARSALVGEYLLYRLGIIDDADVEAVVGKKLRLEFSMGGRRGGLFLVTQRPDGRPVAVGEAKLVERLQKRLPEALAALNLTPAERDAVRKLTEPGKDGADEEAPIVEEFTVCGVLRLPHEDELRGRGGWRYRETEVFLPARTAEELLFRSPQARKLGFGGPVSVEVDEVDHVKAVVEDVKGAGMQGYALIEAVEREQYIYVMITSAMTLIALVALLVAAIGITNTMLMSVLERVHEIGVMKAVGARDRDVQRAFLVEGALVGLVGGLLGLGLCWASSFPGDAWVRARVEQRLSVKLEESLFSFPTWLAVGVPLFACVVTTLAAVYPARRAARVSPVQALRYE